MQTRLTIDEAGRITFPPERHLRPSDTLKLATEDGAVTGDEVTKIREIPCSFMAGYLVPNYPERCHTDFRSGKASCARGNMSAQWHEKAQPAL